MTDDEENTKGFVEQPEFVPEGDNGTGEFDPENTVVTAGTPVSLVDLIKAEQRELEEVRDVYIAVKGYERSGLHIRYFRPHNGKVLDDIARRVAREHKDQYNRNLFTSVDTMIELCQGFYVQTPETGDEYVELDPHMNGYPIKFDSALAEVIGGEGLNDSRAVLFALFGDNEFMVLTHMEKLNRWLMNAKADVTTEIWQNMGE